MVPYLNCSDDARFQVMAACSSPVAGRQHDAVAWGLAHGADRLGVDIIQNCEVTGFKRNGNCIEAVETSRGTIGCGKIGFAVAGSTSHLASKLGLKLPIEAMYCRPSSPSR